MGDRSYPSDCWGALAKNPMVEIGADGDGWIAAVHDTWLANGGTEESFERAFPEYARRRAAGDVWN